MRLHMTNRKSTRALFYHVGLGVGLYGFDDELLAGRVEDLVCVRAPGDRVHRGGDLGEGRPEHSTPRPDLHLTIVPGCTTTEHAR